jgi:hypothetical protein
LACNGATQARIAQHLGITEKTLRLHYREQIDFGVESLLSNVLANMATIAIKGHGMPAVAAGKYLLSCRAGYREHSVLGVEPSGEGLSSLMAACGVDSSNVRERILARIAQINGPPDSDNAREIIAGKLAQLAARNGSSPDSSEAYKEPAEGE